MKLVFYNYVILATFATSQKTLSTIVTLSNGGQIQGQLLKSYQNNDYYAFQEIPYATPPLGNLRFKESTEPKPWKGILKTTENNKICIQLTQNDARETEDCLYLNVYVPKNSKSKTTKDLPVYVYIHGGAFYENDGTFESIGPQFFMDYGVVLVTLNYRLGAFGFISTEDDVIPGNLGLKDQRLALQWVQNNIKLFGGDPKQVTLGGQSAGASCVGHHVLSEQSKGLFRSAIQESGSPLNSKMFMRHPRYFAVQLAQSLNDKINENNSSRQILQVLMDASAQQIKQYSNLPIPENLRNAVGNEANSVWNPVEEHSECGFIKGLMHDNFKKGIFNQVPVLIGITSEEEISFDLNVLKTKTKYFDDNAAYLINGNLNIKKENILPAGTELKKVYTDKTFEEDFGAFVRFVSDAKYTTGILRQAELQSKYSDVFLYQFSYDGILGGVNTSIPGAEGVGHVEELEYLFMTPSNKNIDSFPKSDLKVQKVMMKLWTNFIKYLNPLNTNDPEFEGSNWPKVTEILSYQNINKTLELSTNPRSYSKIRNIYEKYSEKMQYTY